MMFVSALILKRANTGSFTLFERSELQAHRKFSKNSRGLKETNELVSILKRYYYLSKLHFFRQFKKNRYYYNAKSTFLTPLIYMISFSTFLLKPNQNFFRRFRKKIFFFFNYFRKFQENFIPFNSSLKYFRRESDRK